MTYIAYRIRAQNSIAQKFMMKFFYVGEHLSLRRSTRSSYVPGVPFN